MNKQKKNELWIEAKKKCKLNDESIRKAKEMGLNPTSLIKNRPSKDELWKAPVNVWIDNMYEKRKEKAKKKKLRKEKLKKESERIKIGCLARYFNRYKDEVKFAKENKFDFVQVWYDSEGLYINDRRDLHIKVLKQLKFPFIIHAVLDINEFYEHIPILSKMLRIAKRKEIIIHPICKSEEITSKTIEKLSEKIREASELFDEKITIYLENNSKIDPIFYTPEEIKYIFDKNPKVEFLLDLAHIDDYEHLKNLIEIKYPKYIHIADKNFQIDHEHLPIGKGELDFRKIFTEYLKKFKGKLILEVFQSDEDIIKSKDEIERIINLCNMIECENSFPVEFANVKEKPYGKIFYNIDNPKSYDSNHAIILNLDFDLRNAIQDIISFYEERKLVPRVYHAFQSKEEKILYPVLKGMDFNIEKLDKDYLFLGKHSKITTSSQLKIVRATDIDLEIKEIIYSAEDDEEWGEWIIKVLEDQVKSKNFYLFIGYINSKPVTMSSLTIMDKFSRVDHVISHNNYRKKGYGKEIVDYLIRYHNNLSDNNLYLYTSNPIALKMYQNMGFVKINLDLPVWMAEKR